MKYFIFSAGPLDVPHEISVWDEKERMDLNVKETEVDVKAVIKESVLPLCKGWRCAQFWKAWASPTGQVG